MRLRVHSPERTFDWESSSAHFRLGRGDACDLRIEGKASQFASWEHAGFSVGNDSVMYVTDLGSSNGTYVDGVRISVATPLRVGSIVQLGRAGPKLEVLALNTAAPIPIPAATPAPTPVDSAPPGPRLLTTLKDWPQRNWLIAGAVVVIAVIGLLAASRSPPAPPLVEHAKVDHIEQKDDAGNKPVETIHKEAGDLKIAQPEPPPPPPDPWKEAKDRGMAAYRLIVVEDPVTQIAWPHAGSIVVGEHVLLTTAYVARELQKARDREWLVSVMQPPEGRRVPIATIRVNAEFGQAEEELFFDSALLYVDEPLTGAITLASSDDQLERGQPLICIAIDHDGDSLDRFHPLTPEGFEREIFSAPRFLDPKQPGSPRLLRLKGTLGEKVLGSPIVDKRGRLVALYCGPTEELKATSGLELSYAKVIDPEMIRRGLERRDDPLWVEPPANPVEK